MASQVAIANLALQAMGGRSKVDDLDEGSNEANNVKLLWDVVRDELLSMAWWGFAKRTAALALLKAAPGTEEFTGDASEVWSASRPAPPWLYAYSYPTDCVRARFIQGTLASAWPADTPTIFPYGNSSGPAGIGAPSLFTISDDTDSGGTEVTSILTNQSQALLTYTRRITNPERFSVPFIRALTMVLASRLIGPLSGDKKMIGHLVDVANAIVVETRVNEANEGLTVIDHVPETLRIRGVSWDTVSGGFTLPYPPLFTA